MMLSSLHLRLFIRVARLEGSRVVESSRIDWFENAEQAVNFGGREWMLKTRVVSVKAGERKIRLELTAKTDVGSSSRDDQRFMLSLGVELPQWSAAGYVLFPAAAYNGNRFEVDPQTYPPMFKEDDDQGPETPPVLTDVPRLSVLEGMSSRIQQLAGDLAVPAIGMWHPAMKAGVILQSYQADEKPYGIDAACGFEFSETPDRKTGTMYLSVPGVREETMYKHMSTRVESVDRGAIVEAGESLMLSAQLLPLSVQELTGLFDKFFEIRNESAFDCNFCNTLPYSKAFAIQQEKYNAMNWQDQCGYYSVGLRENLYQDWQVGWVGGLMSTLPLLMCGGAESQERAFKTIDYAFTHTQGKFGLFYGMAQGTECKGDDFYHPENKAYHLIRKSADALYFLITHYELLKNRNVSIKPFWKEGTLKLADAFVKLWDAHGQFGQFVDADTGRIIVGGSASASMAPGALALAGKYFDRADYLRVAEASAKMFYASCTQKGIANGGPGEILSCPDSESAFGLLESYMALYEVTGKPEYLKMAEDAAKQAASWVIDYDYPFPPHSAFGKLNIRTHGAVFANVQNKHGAPGVCTLSGVSLLKLFRATGDRRYLQLIHNIAHGITQYVSREDAPVTCGDKVMPPGFVNERVNTSDWAEPIGEIFYGSTWAEVACMLTCTQIPGVYAQSDTGVLCAFDHVDAQWADDRKSVVLSNPTKFDAVVRVLAETSSQAKKPLGANPLLENVQITEVPSGGSVTVKIVKN